MTDTVKHIDDGGAAFPVLKQNAFGSVEATIRGMTLRDWFAGQSLSGMFNHVGWVNTCDDDQIEVAKRAYAIADAMIAARKAEEGR